ncbi:hypothetical protein E3N88_01905 [Mikania micrantha]|uniref:TauD/TfdA-like domain-containing protein n=1 Tax=Mikania micrantha TaxID=192012 RepID=A0A5N6Q2F4_9ASTR|nr:hypothetical protein E3N88_01905 [Mikania micrantha]
MEYNCKEFKVGKCEGEKLVDGEILPLVLAPPEPKKNGIDSLLESLKKNKEWFDEMVTKNSAVLLRGFDVKNAVEFNDIVEAFGWEDIRYVGPAPRTHVHKRVWTANEGPLSEFIYYHHEMVLINEFPKKVILFCEVPPPEGGETPFVPSFKVTERMMEEFPEFVDEVEEKGLKYTFIALSSDNTTSMRGRGWQDAFATHDQQEAERRYACIPPYNNQHENSKGKGARDGRGMARKWWCEDDFGTETIDKGVRGKEREADVVQHVGRDKTIFTSKKSLGCHLQIDGLLA